MPFSSISEPFDEVLRRIELNPARVALATQRYNAVKSAIEGALPGKTVTQIGSFQRKTKIRPADLGDELDIDAVVSFKTFTQYATDGNGVSPPSALETVRRALISHETYSVMAPTKDHPVVTLRYADDMKVELIPAFVDATGTYSHPVGQPQCYVIGTISGNWEAADYDYDAAMISALNAKSNKKLVPMIKLVKAYFREKSLPLKSFHVELLVATIVPTIVGEWDAKNYTYGYQFLLAEFLRRASSTITTPVSLPGSYSPAINSNLGQPYLFKLGMWLNGQADEAWRLCKVERVAEAVAGWCTFFGDPFPS